MTRDFGLVRMILGGREGCRYISRTAIVSARSTMSAGMPSTMGYLRSQAMQTRHESSARKSAWQAGQASCAMVDAANVGGAAGLVGMACAVSDFRCQISAVLCSLSSVPDVVNLKSTERQPQVLRLRLPQRARQTPLRMRASSWCELLKHHTSQWAQLSCSLGPLFP